MWEESEALFHLQFTFASAKYLGRLPAWDHFAFETSGFRLPTWGHRSRWGWFTVISVSGGSVLLTGSVLCHHRPSGSHCNAKGQLNFASLFAWGCVYIQALGPGFKGRLLTVVLSTFSRPWSLYLLPVGMRRPLAAAQLHPGGKCPWCSYFPSDSNSLLSYLLSNDFNEMVFTFYPKLSWSK